MPNNKYDYYISLLRKKLSEFLENAILLNLISKLVIVSTICISNFKITSN